MISLDGQSKKSQTHEDRQEQWLPGTGRWVKWRDID